MSNEATNQRKPGEVKLLLNDGKSELDQATVSARWVFDEKALDSVPTHLLFIDQRIAGENSFREGVRTFCAVESAKQYLQLHWAGDHHITVFAFHLSGKGVDSFEEKAIKDENAIHSRDGGYYLSLGEENQWAVAMGEVSCIVPEELFATKPKSVFSKALWDYCHMFSKGEESKDQCEYRALKMKMIPLAPFLGILFVLWKVTFFLGGIGNSFIAIVYWFAVALSGFRPEPLWDGVCEAFKFNRTPKEGMYDGYEGGGYRYLGKFGDSAKEWVWWITPLEAVAVAFGPWAIMETTMNPWLFWMLFSISAIVFLVLLSRFGVFGKRGVTPEDIRKREEDRETRLAQYEAEEEKKYQEWLREYYAKFNGLPGAYSGKEKFSRIFRLSFWNLKAKVCKPFSE